MGQNVISSNISTKVSQKVGGGGTNTGTSVLVYTVPANTYAVVNVEHLPTGGAAPSYFTIGSASGLRIASGSTAATYYSAQSVYLGPGETLYSVNGHTTNTAWKFTGVEFINSP